MDLHGGLPRWSIEFIIVKQCRAAACTKSWGFSFSNSSMYFMYEI